MLAVAFHVRPRLSWKAAAGEGICRSAPNPTTDVSRGRPGGRAQVVRRAEHRPGDAVLGEETGATGDRCTGDVRWVSIPSTARELSVGGGYAVSSRRVGGHVVEGVVCNRRRRRVEAPIGGGRGRRRRLAARVTIRRRGGHWVGYDRTAGSTRRRARGPPRGRDIRGRAAAIERAWRGGAMEALEKGLALWDGQRVGSSRRAGLR